MLSSRDLPNTGLVSNVDPYIKVYYTNRTVTEPVKFATTEVVKNEPNPEFTTVVTFTWNRGQQQVHTYTRPQCAMNSKSVPVFHA